MQEHRQTSNTWQSKKTEQCDGIGLIFTMAVGTLSCRPGLEESPASPTESKPEVLTGEYLGQKPPGMKPELFAPGLVSTGLSERDMAITLDGTEIYFTAVLGSSYTFSAIVGYRQLEDRWKGRANPWTTRISGS